MHFTLAFTKVFVFNDGQITKGQKKSCRGDEFQMGLHCFKKHAFNKFSWEQKRRVKKFFDDKKTWKTREKFKLWFIQKPWIYLLVKSRSSQIIYIINIMAFSKLAQEIYFYLIVASFYLIRRKLRFLFIHSFHPSSHALMNDFKSRSREENVTKSCIFEYNYFFCR